MNMNTNLARRIAGAAFAAAVLLGGPLSALTVGPAVASAAPNIPDINFCPNQRHPDDCDNDGLYTHGENLFGTNPIVPDTDGDGWNDGFEVQMHYDPLDPTS